MQKSQGLTALLLLILLQIPSSSFADGIFWGCNYQPRTIKAGTLSCYQQVKDCRKTILSCKQEGKPLFTIEDFADYIAVSENGKYIVGLSNHGSTNAFWVRDTQNKLISSQPHGPSNHYCLESVTNIRQWFDEKNPNVKFKLEGDQLSGVTIRSCDGKEISLLSKY